MQIVTRKNIERIARFAFEYAILNKRKQITAVHKANIQKLGDGLFLKVCFNNMNFKCFKNIFYKNYRCVKNFLNVLNIAIV